MCGNYFVIFKSLIRFLKKIIHRITEPFSALTNKNNNPLCMAGQLGSVRGSRQAV